MVSEILLLASNSPRRRELIKLTGWPFSIRPANVDESALPGETPADYVVRVAETKAKAVLGASVFQLGLVLACDTIVVDGTVLLGKPSNKEDARSMLTRLRGRVHQVLSAIVVFHPGSERIERDLCSTDVPMRDYSDAEIDAYIATGDPMDKAGAYAVQHTGFHPVENLRGCYASVMGLPLCHLTRTLKTFDMYPDVDIPTACRSALGYQCPVHPAVLQGLPSVQAEARRIE